MILKVRNIIGFVAASGLSTGAISTPNSGLDRAAAAYDRAQLLGDRAALNRLLAADYVLVNSSGERETKTQFVADLTDPAFKLKPFFIQAPVRRTWPGGAVLGGVARQTGTSAGKSFDVCLRFADVWKLTRAGWQVVFTHVARAAAPGPSGCAEK